jgi:hypothetical protein
MSGLILKKFARRGSARALMLVTVAVLTSWVSGCAATAPVPVMALPAPTIRPVPLGNGSPADPWTVTIHFENATSCKITHVTEDNATCPSVTLPGFCVLRGKFVQWESDPDKIKYNIYFDPIQGQPLNSDANGILKRPVDPNAPFTLYKYSILRDGCNSETDTYDPHMRVDN